MACRQVPQCRATASD